MLDMLKTRRSIRRFQDKEVEKEKIDVVLKAALLSPSSRSRRPWEFILVKDKEMLKMLSESREHGSQLLEGASLCIVVLADPEACDVWIEDASIAAIIMQLTAHSLGLGSCWVQVRERVDRNNEKSEDYIKKLLSIPQKYNVECMIAMGYPAEKKNSYDEENLPYDKIHFEKY